MSVIFETSLGDLTIDLFCAEAPKTTENFLKLCKIKHYDHCLFFDIQKDFSVQCGDPTNTGKGGSSIWGYAQPIFPVSSFHCCILPTSHRLLTSITSRILKGDAYKYMKDEISPKLKHEKKGIVAMATSGKDMVGSLFYITTSSHLNRLDGKYTIIGEVVQGLETLDKLNEAVVDVSGRPIQVLRIQHTIVLDDPFPDPEGLIRHVPDRSPSPPRKWPVGLLPEPDDLNALLEAETEESRREHLAAQAAQAKAEALVLLGELPDADVRPPDNILFVCKLNPATVGRSLAIPFSRFGRVVSSEVVTDRRGESLCYAFIEFDERAACEEAYLKMQNVVIDGRRIHVDFCQSVAKVDNFRSAGGWKSFFAKRAHGFNDDEGSQGPASQGSGLQFKRGMNAPMSFSRGGARLDNSSSRDHHNGRESSYRDSHQDGRGRDDYRRGSGSDRHGRDDRGSRDDYRDEGRDSRRYDHREDRRDYRDDDRRSGRGDQYDDRRGSERDSRYDDSSRGKRRGSPPRNEGYGDPDVKRSKYQESRDGRY